jgi:glutathione synthase/RimK-type ligase-like ATP-grasp enzyme
MFTQFNVLFNLEYSIENLIAKGKKMKDVVLIITNNGDVHATLVIDRLHNIGQASYRFNTEQFPLNAALTVTLKGGAVGSILTTEGPLDLNRVKSVWYRRPTAPLIEPGSLSDGYAKFIRNESGAALWSLYTTLEAFWMNPPLTNRYLIQNNKLFQLKVASQIGLDVPDTIITNRPEDLASFCKAHGGIVAVKMLKGDWFMKEGEDGAYFLFTQKITTQQILNHADSIKLSPILAEEYIDKALELRITIIGDQIFACAIHSQHSERTKIDWRRYDFENVPHEACSIPEEVRSKLLLYMRRLGLVYGAIDMIITPDNHYVFIEINPSGQWLWIEELTGMPISQTIAALLANPPTITGE